MKQRILMTTEPPLLAQGLANLRLAVTVQFYKTKCAFCAQPDPPVHDTAVQARRAAVRPVSRVGSY